MYYTYGRSPPIHEPHLHCTSSIRKKCLLVSLRSSTLPPVRQFPANYSNSTRKTLATAIALAGLGVAALNLSPKSDAAKKAQADVGTPGQSFALGGCERSGRSFLSPSMHSSRDSLTHLLDVANLSSQHRRRGLIDSIIVH